MTDMRQCDVCAEVQPIAASWWFVTIGKREPSQWSNARHWCDTCMKLAIEHLS